jgi:hypothetical protein
MVLLVLSTVYVLNSMSRLLLSSEQWMPFAFNRTSQTALGCEWCRKCRLWCGVC